MAKVLSVEIGVSLIYMCEVDYKSKNPKVYKRTTIQIPEGCVREDGIEVTDALVEAVKEGMAAAGIRAKKLIFSLNSTKIASRDAIIPYVKESKVESVIRTNATEYFPVDLEQYELGHSIEEVIENEKGVKQYRVHVLAVPKSIIEDYYDLARALGASIEAFDYSGNSIYQMVHAQCDTGVQMVVKIGERSSSVTILRDSIVSMQRTIPYGIDEAVVSIIASVENGAISYLNALDLLTHGQADVSMDYLANGIARVMDYYNSRNTGAPVERAYITGVGGDCSGLAPFLTDALGIPVHTLLELEGFHLEKAFKGESFGRYLTCIGAAVAPLGFMGEKADKGMKMEVTPQNGDIKKLSLMIGIGGVAIAVVLAVVSYINLASTKLENTSLQNRVAELEPVRDIYKAYLQEQYTNTKLNYLYDSTVLPGENLVEFIEELEQKMPNSLNVQSFTAGNDGVSMSLTVKDKKEASKLIQQLRSFDSIASVSVSGMTDSGAVMVGEAMEQEGNVSFSVTLTYKGADEMAAELMAQEAAAQNSAATENADTAESQDSADTTSTEEAQTETTEGEE